MTTSVRCGWCRRPPSDYLLCDSSPCGLLAAELDIATRVVTEHDDDPTLGSRSGGSLTGEDGPAGQWES